MPCSLRPAVQHRHGGAAPVAGAVGAPVPVCATRTIDVGSGPIAPRRHPRPASRTEYRKRGATPACIEAPRTRCDWRPYNSRAHRPGCYAAQASPLCGGLTHPSQGSGTGNLSNRGDVVSLSTAPGPMRRPVARWRFALQRVDRCSAFLRSSCAGSFGGRTTTQRVASLLHGWPLADGRGPPVDAGCSLPEGSDGGTMRLLGTRHPHGDDLICPYLGARRPVTRALRTGGGTLLPNNWRCPQSTGDAESSGYTQLVGAHPGAPRH